jgi:tRNA nucleotidyltransferase (CCA-adding enzyme)
LTRRMSEKETSEIRRLIPRRDLVEAWQHLENDAKELTKKLMGKEAATPSRAWQVLSEARPEIILFTEITVRQQAATQKIANFFGKWRQLRQRLPLPEMAELRITPALPEYSKITEGAFLLLLDGKLRSRTEIMKYLKPFEPPPPPPPPAPAKRGRAAKAEAAAAAAAARTAPSGEKRKTRGAGKTTEPAPEKQEAAQVKPSPARTDAGAAKEPAKQPKKAALKKATPKKPTKPASKPKPAAKKPVKKGR